MALTKEERRERQREHNRKWEAAHPEQAQEMKRKAQQRYRETHQEQIREAQRRWKETHPHYEYPRQVRKPERRKQRLQNCQELVQSILAGKVCVMCGEADTAKLVFHHTDPTTKRFNVGGCSYGEAAILAEIAKCVIWCRSCHGKFHNTLHHND